MLDLDSSQRGGRAPPTTASAAPPKRAACVGERFAAGVATSTDVLDAQVALLQAELDRTRALASVRLAEARLRAGVGREAGPTPIGSSDRWPPSTSAT